MSVFTIRGGKPLVGEVTISGAKNAASKMLLASLLTQEEVVLKNVPRQQETQIAQDLLEMIGTTCNWRSANEISLKTEVIKTTNTTSLSRKNRLSILTLAPLLHRTGEAFVPSVGGDAIGPRPVNFHIEILRSMGAEIEEIPEGYRAKTNKRLRGTVIDLAYPSVGATETALFAGVLAEGRTTIKNAASEPEVAQLIMMLQTMGAIIQMNANRHIEIFGVERLHGTVFTVMPDRIEAASYAAMAMGTRGEILVRGAEHQHMMTFLNAVRRIGGEYKIQPEGILFCGKRPLKGIELETDTHPGFMTDWQQPFVTILTQAEGTSVVHETVYEERFGYTETLKKMGADISLFSNCLGEIPCRFKGMNYKHSTVINGPTKLNAATVVIPDIRAGLAFVVAALMAEGESILTGIEHLDRGYESLEEKLKNIGADIKRS